MRALVLGLLLVSTEAWGQSTSGSISGAPGPWEGPTCTCQRPECSQQLDTLWKDGGRMTEASCSAIGGAWAGGISNAPYSVDSPLLSPGHAQPLQLDALGHLKVVCDDGSPGLGTTITNGQMHVICDSDKLARAYALCMMWRPGGISREFAENCVRIFGAWHKRSVADDDNAFIESVAKDLK